MTLGAKINIETAIIENVKNGMKHYCDTCMYMYKNVDSSFHLGSIVSEPLWFNV